MVLNQTSKNDKRTKVQIFVTDFCTFYKNSLKKSLIFPEFRQATTFLIKTLSIIIILNFKAGWINVWHNHLSVDITMVWIFLPLVYFKNPALFNSTSFKISVKIDLSKYIDDYIY